MSARKPRWEIVQTAAGFHARFRSSNGRLIVSSEVYKRRDSAAAAIDLVNWPAVLYAPVNQHYEVREIDERTQP